MNTLSKLVLRDVEQGKLPKYLYKFRSIDETLDKIISNGSLWFAAPLSFNDPFDCQIKSDSQNTVKEIRGYLKATFPNIGADELSKIENIIAADSKYWPGILSPIITKIVNNKGICCFSSHNKNILMWSHYSDSHKGLTFKFDVSLDPGFFVHPITVSYSDEYPVYNHIRDSENLVKLLIQNKSALWNYEDEVRVLKSDVGAYTFNKNALVEVCFGCNCDPSEIARVRKTMIENGYENTIFKKAQASKNKYELRFDNL
jgi:hypothetical protein